MISESEKNNSSHSEKHSKDFLIKPSKQSIELFSTITLLCIVSVILLFFLDQKILGALMILTGTVFCVITIRKFYRLNYGYKESINEFSSLNEKKDNVIQDFSHKIREPLNNMVIIGDMLLESGLEKKQKELLETLIASTNNMVSIVNKLTMQSAGNLRYESRKSIRFNLLYTVQNTIDLYNLKEKANIEFELEMKDANIFEYYGDPIIFKQILLDVFNTIENQVYDKAIKVQIDLRKIKDSGDTSTIELKILTDTRVVIVNDLTSERSLAARLISSGKGTFHQEVGDKSTMLKILLPFSNPVTKPQQTVVSSKIEKLIPKEKTPKELKDIKILLVEDNLINQKITLLTLNPLVNSIDTASNGKEALDKFGTSNYDIILMDIQMPVMSGLVASEKIRAIEATTNSHVPIIAITANAMLGDKEKCLSVGIDDYISKPFQPSVLIEKIKEYI